MLPLVLLAVLPPLQLPSQSRTLKNGLTVIVSEDHSVPGVAVDLHYRVGSKDEEPGRTGFAHLFEHLMFMGAQHAPYPRFDTIMEAAGGTNNASTENDSTHYYEAGPANLLETFFWLEADRLASLGRTMTAEKLETQRKVVLNERRQSYENAPYGEAELALDDALFPPGHPYHWPVIGSAHDLEAATLDDVKHFFARWYAPDNASLAVVGDVEAEKVFALAERDFGFIPRAAPKRGQPPPPVVLQAQKRLDLTDKVELTRVMLAWPSPKNFAEGDAEADLLATILAHGKAARLYERLVHAEELAVDVEAQQEGRELQSVFRLSALLPPGGDPARVIAEIDQELAKLAREPVAAAELESARLRIYTAHARSLESILGRAEQLNLYQVQFGTPDGLRRDLARYEAVTPQSLQAEARKLFVPGRVVVVVRPQKAQAAVSHAALKSGGAR